MSAAPPLSLAWLVHVRDNENLTVYEFALGSLYATCGEGKRIFLSDKGAADVLSIKRHTVAAARKGLLAKGLIEDTGQHGSQPQQREYRLAVPVRRDGPQTATPCTPNGHRGGPQTAIGVVPIRAQHQDSDQEVDQATHQHHGPDDDGQQENLENPQTPSPSAGASGSDEAPGDEWPGFDWDDPDDGVAFAEDLGVPVASIGKPFRDWIEGLVRSGGLDLDGDVVAFHSAVEASVGRQNPVGYFKSILPGHVAQHRAKREQAAEKAKEAAAAEAAEQAAKELAERELWESTEPIREKILATITGNVPLSVRPLGSVYVRSVRDAPNLQDVWYDPEFKVCFPHSRHNPGPDWKIGHLSTSEWNKVMKQARIPLIRAS